MGKYIFYVFFALIILFTANYFGFIRIPWLDLPGSATIYKDNVDTYQQKVDDQMSTK